MIIHPCIWADNNAKEMAELYCQNLPGTEIIAENPTVVMLEVAGQKLMLLNGGDVFRPNPAISMHLNLHSEAEVEKIWNAFSAEGKVMMPLDSYPWSRKYAWVQDKFGVSWQLFFTEIPAAQIFVPSLMFANANAGRAQEAMDFYTKIFPDSKINKIQHYDGKIDKPENINHADFQLYGCTMYCMDSSHPHEFDFTEGLSLVVNCKDQQEIDQYWRELKAGGGAESRCGWLKDKFGVSWQIVPENLGRFFTNPETAKKVIAAVMTMKKLDIAAMEAAAH